jgi:hypothetical protein
MTNQMQRFKFYRYIGMFSLNVVSLCFIGIMQFRDNNLMRLQLQL